MNVPKHWKVVNWLKTVKFNQNYIIFGFFLIVSAIFWFFNALSREYYTELKIPVEYINLPENRLQLGNTNEYITVKVSAFGYQVIDFKTSLIKAVLIDVKKLNLKPLPGNKRQKYYLLTSTLRDEISSVLGPKLKIDRISPDSLFLELTKVGSKKVLVKKNFEIQFRKQFKLYDSIQFTPDSIKIKGPESILDTIDAVYTKNIIIEDVHDPMVLGVELEKISGTEILPKNVKCLLPVEEYTEMEFKVPVHIINEPIGFNVKLFPSEARIIFNIGFSSYNKITSEQFRLAVDYSELDKSQNSRAFIKIIKSPENVSQIRIEPQSVDYMIEKND